MCRKSWILFSSLRNLRSLLFFVFVFATPAVCQDRAADESALRGNRAEISVTLKDNSGQLIGVPVTVKLYRLGTLTGQSVTSKGRALFILNSLGDYTISAEAPGYRSTQKDISVPVAVDAEEELILQRDSSTEGLGTSANPVLAPKAKEAFDKGLQALNDNKLEAAEKNLDEAARLAPNHPNILYLQGVLFLRQRHWEKARNVLEKATQIDPKNAHAFSALGMAFADENKYDLAIAPLQQSLQLDPVSWETHWTLAKAYYHEAQYDGALKESQEALKESHGAEPAIELLLAQAQVATGRFEESAETLRSFLKNHPNDKGAATAHRWLDRLAADGKIRKL
jgi:tetratricopeptide (TPR) repeat protein